MESIPKIKKKISSFLIGEEGKISKDKLLKIGVAITAASFLSLNAAEGVNTHSNRYTHTNELTSLDCENQGCDAEHGSGWDNTHNSHNSHNSADSSI